MYTKEFERDGIVYHIEVFELNGKFRAQWHCPRCDARGRLDGFSNTSGEATGRCQSHVITDHHIPVHVLNTE